MKKHMIHNNQGMVLVLTIVFVLIVSILVVGFMSRNSSQVITTFEQSKRFQAEALLESAMWNAYMHFDTNGSLPSNYQITVNSIVYNVNFRANSEVNGIIPFNVTIHYN